MKNDFTLKRVEVNRTFAPGVTYVVSLWNEVAWVPQYTRHVVVMAAAGWVHRDIIWGGILDDQGNWVRGSIDFGDATELEERLAVVELLQKELK